MLPTSPTAHTTTASSASPTGDRPPAVVALLPGDGIGPEIGQAVREVLEAAGAELSFEEHAAGLSAVEAGLAANGLPDATMAAIRSHGLALKGPTATPAGSGHKSVNVTIRKGLGLYANVRPVRSWPGANSRYEGVDLVIVRENIEDTYGGIEHCQTPDVVQCLKVITRPGSLAIVRYAFELARAWGRKRVLCVHKANIHKLSDGLFLACFREVAAGYPDVEAADMLVDNACMQLVTAPEQFDVIVTMNLYGDIISDLAAGLVGGLGLAPSANVGDDVAVFEAVHGTAPDIAGRGLANPTALLLAATMLLRHVGQGEVAERIEKAIATAMQSGARTRDLGGTCGTAAFVEAVKAALPPAGAHTAVARPLATPPRAEVKSVIPAPWELRGADLFVRHDGLPALPERVGPLELRMISNRGTKIYPGPLPEIALVDWHRARYLAASVVSDADVLALVAALPPGVDWMHLEKLHYAANEPCFSKAQGE